MSATLAIASAAVLNRHRQAAVGSFPGAGTWKVGNEENSAQAAFLVLQSTVRRVQPVSTLINGQVLAVLHSVH